MAKKPAPLPHAVSARLRRAGACAAWWALALPAMGQSGVPPVDAPLTSGRLRPAGDYLSRHEAHTATVLPGGAVFVYGLGLPVDARQSPRVRSEALRQRLQHGIPSAADASPQQWDPLKRGWRRLPTAPECASPARHGHTATALPDGKVLIAGGMCDLPKMADDLQPHAPHAALSLWDATARRWLPAPSLRQARIQHTANLLPDGGVMVVGGESDPGLSTAPGEPVLGSVERIAQGQVSDLAPLSVARAGHTATVLANGDVLVAGGFDREGMALASAELWEAGSRAWRTVPPMQTPRQGHTATRLADGRVLIAGGLGIDGQPLPSVELWDPARQVWNVGPELPIPLVGHAATLLSSGRVLVAGGAWVASHTAPVPWAWTWEATSAEWQVAGHTMPSSESELSAGITLAPRPDGGALVFARSHIMRWEPNSATTADAAPLWQSRPSAARLPDDRVMWVGRESGDVGNGRPVARIWNPRDGTWVDAGRLNQSSWMREDSIALPSGRVIHVGIDSERTLQCEAWDPAASGHWQRCGSVGLQYLGEWRVQLGLMPDGRAFAIANRHEVMVYDEARAAWAPWPVEWHEVGTYGVPIRSERPLARIHDPAGGPWIDIDDAAARFLRSVGGGPSLLWDGTGRRWAYAFPDHRMGRDAQWLPDGCALSTQPLAVFDPRTGQARALADPGFGLDGTGTEMVVLRDGTVAVAGVPAGAKDTGAGFFHGKASCAGFEVAAGDDGTGYIAGGLVAQDAPPPPPPAASAAPLSRTAAWREQALQMAGMLHTHRWLLLACIGPVLAYGVLRRLGLRRIQVGRGWVLRLLIYGLLLIFLSPAVWSFLAFTRLTSHPACEESAQACLDLSTGLLRSPEETAGPHGAADGKSVIPCRMVGVWSSRRGNLMHRIELKDDGTYAMEPNVAGVGNRTGYTGHWAVQGQTMAWRHDQGGSDLDVNPIQPEGDGRFTLVEGDGQRTRFELIRAVASTRCSP